MTYTHSPDRPVALITGASRGLGLALGRELARRGWALAIAARGADMLDAAAKELGQVAPVLARPGDVADADHAHRLVHATLEHFGRLDALVNNASTVGPSPMPALAVYPTNALAMVLATNVLAPLRLIQTALPVMRARGGGVIVNVTSDAGVQAYPGWGGYGASKAALEHVTRTLAVELADTGIRVYAVDPGDMNTQMHREAEPGVDLSGLPGPEPAARGLAHLIEHGTASSGRFEAQRLAADLLAAAR